MSHPSKLHLQQLDLKPGASLLELRKAYRDLTLIWHPDRQPEHLKARAQEKLIAINEAYQFFLSFPEALNFTTDDSDDFFSSINRPKLDSPFEVKVVKKECIRCHGSGKVAVDVNWKGSFVHETCKICKGRGIVFVDPRHECKDCNGDGLNSKITHEERQVWIDSKLKTNEWWKRNLNPIIYKKLWLKFHHDHLICGTCRGAGYQLFKHDFRKQERRLECETDYLHHISHSEQRNKDRRHSHAG